MYTLCIDITGGARGKRITKYRFIITTNKKLDSYLDTKVRTTICKKQSNIGVSTTVVQINMVSKQNFHSLRRLFDSECKTLVVVFRSDFNILV